MDDYIAKPVRQKELVEVISRWLPVEVPAVAAGVPGN
jgi:CheY-like chemotaxis protein